MREKKRFYVKSMADISSNNSGHGLPTEFYFTYIYQLIISNRLTHILTILDNIHFNRQRETNGLRKRFIDI